MGMILVFPLMLAILSTRWCQGNTAGKSDDSCHEMCPAGYFKVGECINDGPHKCRRCPTRSFTAIPNKLIECLRCATCKHYQEEIKPCSSISDVECGCNKGYYKLSGQNSQEGIQCQRCECESCEDTYDRGSRRKCEACERKECLQDSKCQKSCNTTDSPPVNTTVMKTSLMVSTPAPSPVIPEDDPSPWMLIVVPLVTLVVLFWLLLLFIYFIRYPHSCSFGNKKKHVEAAGKDIEYNVVDSEATEELIVGLYGESHRHPGSSPTTPTLQISEESPMMTLSHNPAKQDHPAHISALLLDTEHKVARQEMHWPAIVLYTIIKEVPLRRWKEFLRLLAVSDQQMERVEMEAGLGLGSVERQYQMLRLWSQRSSASLADVFSALHYMDLSGCAQLLQDSLKNLQWKVELLQDFKAC